MGMLSIEQFIENKLIHGRAYFSREEVHAALGLNPQALTAAITRLVKKRRLAIPRHGFYLTLRAEDTVTGAPDPIRWIDPLMGYLEVQYRISLLRAAAEHGASHQASMVFQVIVPKQQRNIQLGRHRIQFVYQKAESFALLNAPDLHIRIKSESGFANAAGIELTLLDCARYLRIATGIHGVAQIVKDIGAQANPRKLAKAAVAYDSATVRRLGFLLEMAGCHRQAKALMASAQLAKSAVPLSPSLKPLLVSPVSKSEKNSKWKLLINEPVEIDF